MNRFVPFVLLAALGCGGQPTADVERGKAAVMSALDSWKANAPPSGVEFAEELRGTHALTGYTLGKIDTTDKAVFRYAVTLKLKDKKGKESDREVVYAVALKATPVVSRDPYY